MNCKVSLIIPSYNNCSYLEKLLKHLLKINQNNDYEIVIVDDASTDGTRSMLKKYKFENKVIIINLDKNHGVSYARNVGIANSNGIYVGFLDSDDDVTDDFFDNLYNVLDLDFDCIVFGTKMTYRDYEEDYLPNLSCFNDKKDIIAKNKYLDIYFINWVTNKLFKRSIVLKHKFDINYKTGEDLKFMSEIFADLNKYYFINKVMYIYNRTNCNSITRTKINDIVDVVYKSIFCIKKMIKENKLDIEYFNRYKIGMINYCEKKLAESVDDINLRKLLMSKLFFKGDVTDEEY